MLLRRSIDQVLHVNIECITCFAYSLPIPSVQPVITETKATYVLKIVDNFLNCYNLINIVYLMYIKC